MHKSSSDDSLTLSGSTGGYAFTSYGSNEAFSGYYNGYSGVAGSIVKVINPDKVVFLADAKAPNPYDYNVLWSSTDQSTLKTMLDSDFSERLALDRHDLYSSVLFIDGHLKSLDVTELDQAWLDKGIGEY
jgi:prepilin-type processing-associated H-X9-DG protein